MIHVLFLSEGSSARSEMAAGFAQQVAPEGQLMAYAAVANWRGQGPIEDSRARRVMAEVGVDLGRLEVEAVSQVWAKPFDLVIAVSRTASVDRSVLPGAPALVRWDIPAPPEGESPEAWERMRAVREEVRGHVEELFAGGYLPTLVSLKHNSELVLDHLSDGVVAHDLHRRITWFNLAAERITGRRREEVLGKLCPEVFPGGLCGGRCSFREGVPNFEQIRYPLKVSRPDGRERQVEMSVVAMKDAGGRFEGVLATMHDVTEVSDLRRQLRSIRSFHGIIGADEQMQEVYELISDLAASDCPVLVQGESGTGKELAAGAIHGESRRAGKPFVTVNCGALPEGILESELFGHVRGAFTGAIRDKKGRFSLADGGTIFLDEVGELTSSMQVKLLRVLQEGSFTPVGGEQNLSVDVRVISATNRDLREMVRRGQFREDLFYRLCVVPVTLPPLRKRRNDIPLLVEHFVKRFSESTGRKIEGVTSDALHAMLDYSWPGNIRELQNAIQYAFVKCKAEMVDTEHLPPEILSYLEKYPVRAPLQRRGKLDVLQVQQALRETGGNKRRAAQRLGVGRATLYRFLDRHPQIETSVK